MDGLGLQNILIILEIFVILGGGWAFLWKMQLAIGVLNERLTSNLAAFTTRLDNLDVKIDKKSTAMEQALLQLAKQEERMNNIDERMQELSNRQNGKRSTKRP